MTRVLSSACIVLVLLGLGGVAWAGGKPPIAILGLEVNDTGNGIDPETTKAAKEVTAALRDRAKAGTGPYALVANGDKELIDEKLLNNCDTEAASCMATIGSGLGAEVLMFGKIERSTQTMYKVSIKLLNVNRKQIASSTVEMLPIAESSSPRVSTHARAWYSKLAGGNVGGVVVVKANIDRGTVLIDNDMKGTLASGTLSITGLTEGRHTLAIEAKDYQRYETSITVRNGETIPHSATLVEMPKQVAKRASRPAASDPAAISTEGTVAAKSKSNLWKPAFYATTVAGAGALGYTLWQYKLATDAAEAAGAPAGKSQKDCGKSEPMGLETACRHYRNYTIGWITSSVLGAAAITSFVMAYVRDGSSETKMATGKRKRREFAITPVVTPGGGGATLRFDW
jgi:PEGA domain